MTVGDIPVRKKQSRFIYELHRVSVPAAEMLRKGPPPNGTADKTEYKLGTSVIGMYTTPHTRKSGGVHVGGRGYAKN